MSRRSPSHTLAAYFAVVDREGEPYDIRKKEQAALENLLDERLRLRRLVAQLTPDELRLCRLRFAVFRRDEPRGRCVHEEGETDEVPRMRLPTYEEVGAAAGMTAGQAKRRIAAALGKVATALKAEALREHSDKVGAGGREW